MCHPSEAPHASNRRILYVDHLDKVDQERARKMSTEWSTGKWENIAVSETLPPALDPQAEVDGRRGSLAKLASQGSMREGRHRMRVATKATAKRGSVEDIAGAHHINIPTSSLRDAGVSSTSLGRASRVGHDAQQPLNPRLGSKRSTPLQVVEI